MKKIFSCIILVVLSISLLTLTINVKEVKADAGPKIIYVDDDNVLGPWYGNQTHPYQNITSGLEHASANASDTIFVYNGTYNEDLVVNKTVFLKGENRNITTISETGTKIVVNVTASNVSISGFTINNSGMNAPCIYTESQNLTVENCRIINRYIGIYVCESVGLNVTNSMIVGGSYTSIAAQRSSRISITYNELTNVSKGHGIDLNGSNTVTVAYNDITHNLNGVFLCNEEADYFDITISNNYIANNIEGAGIKIRTGDYRAYPATIMGNTITNNKYAIHHTRYSENSPWYPHNFYYNNFIDNHNNNITFDQMTAANNWNDSYPSGGNYWSNYNGTDTHSGPNQTEPGWDGIGDTAYLMDENNVDRYPVMNPWPLAHLQVHTFADGQGEIEGVKVWVNVTEQPQYSPADFLLELGIYTVKVETSFTRQDPQDPTKYYRYLTTGKTDQGKIPER